MKNRIYIITTQGCEACSIMVNIIDSIQNRYKNKFEYLIVDRDFVPEWIRNNVILEDFPTVIFVKDDVIKYHFKGTKPAKEIEKILEDINFINKQDIDNADLAKLYAKNTVTIEEVKENMKDVYVTTIKAFDKPVTYVEVRMKNGFTVRETTTCVDPANYSEEIGKEICLKRIEDKIWFLLGYTLQERMYSAKVPNNARSVNS